MPEPIKLFCRDLAFHDKVLSDLGIPDGAFGHHDIASLDEPCFCTEQSTVNRGEDWRRCDDPLVIVRPGFELVIDCMCADGVDEDLLAEAGRRIADEQRREAA